MILLPPEYLTTPNQSTPEEPTHQTYQIPDRSDTQNNTPPDWQSIQLLLQMQQQMQLQLLEMQIQMRQLERKSRDRPSISFPRSQSTNSYSPIMQLGFTLITFLFTELGVKDWTAYSLERLSELYRGLKQYDREIPCQQQRLSLVRELGDRISERSCLYAIGCLYDDQRKGVEKLPKSLRRKNIQDGFEKELLIGFEKIILPLDLSVILLWGELVGDLEKKGRKLPTLDSLITATTKHHNYTLFTRNIKDFDGIDIMLFNPFEN